MNHPQFRWCGVVWCGSGVVEGALLGVDRLAAGEHPDELLDVAGLRLGPLGLADAVQDREAVLAGEDLEHRGGPRLRSEEHTSELQSLMRISYAVFCLKKKNTDRQTH